MGECKHEWVHCIKDIVAECRLCGTPVTIQRLLALLDSEPQQQLAAAREESAVLRAALASLGQRAELYRDDHGNLCFTTTGVGVPCSTCAAAQERAERAEAACEAFRRTLQEYLDWGPMTQSDRYLHETRFRALLAAPDPGAEWLADIRRVAQAALKRCMHDPECMYHCNHNYCDCNAGAGLDDEDYQDVVAIIKRRGWDRPAEGEGESDATQ